MINNFYGMYKIIINFITDWIFYIIMVRMKIMPLKSYYFNIIKNILLV